MVDIVQEKDKTKRKGARRPADDKVDSDSRGILYVIIPLLRFRLKTPS